MPDKDALAAMAQVGAPTLARERFAAPVRALLWVGGFVLALVVCLAWSAGTGVHNDFTQNVWLPSRLLLDGANPYHPAQAQVGAALGQYAGDFTLFNSGKEFHYIYPLWVVMALSPFAMLPLVTATAIWRALNLLLLVWAMGSLLRGWSPAYRALRVPSVVALGLAVFVGSGILGIVGPAPTYRPSFLTLYIGQFAIIELGLLVAVWAWLMSSAGQDSPRRVWGDALCGLALAVLATKPQAVGLPVLLLGLWALSRRRFVIPTVAAGSLALLLIVPNLFYSWSISDWLNIVFGKGQAASQSEVSASVWGLGYQWLGPQAPWATIALALTLVGVAALLPRWWDDLRDRASPVPLALPLTICMNSVISPYMLGYEHVLLLMPALLYLASVGLPGEEAAPAEARRGRMWRLAIYSWMVLLPFVVLAFQATIEREYPAILQSATMLVLCWVAPLGWKKQ